MTILSVVIPAYNEESGIAEIMNRVLAVEESLAAVGVESLELLVVNDGSKDRTEEIAQGIACEHNNVKVITQPNGGYGAALKTGFAQAKGELIGFLDADGTYPPEYFPQLCEAALKGAELVIGSRMAGEKSDMPLTRRIGNLFFAGLLSLLGNQKVSDSASGQRVFKKEILETIYPLPDGLNLTPVMSTRAIHENISIVEVPIPYSERLGRSKLSVVKDGTLFLQSMVWTVLSYNPVRVLGIIGIFFVLLALLFGVGLVIARIQGITSIQPLGVYGLFTMMIFAMLGVSFFSLGVTFNYLVSLFYKRPIRTGLFGKPMFKEPLERKFGWMGALLLLVGFLVGLVSLIMSLNGWEIARLWLYLLGSAMVSLMGAQLIMYWVIISVLDQLNERNNLIEKDLKECEE